MADDLTKQKVINDLRKDIDYYNQRISKEAKNAENLGDQVKIEQMKREKEDRQIKLANIN